MKWEQPTTCGENMAKIININTGRVRESSEIPTIECRICKRNFDPEEEGIIGVIGKLPVTFCTICLTGIVDMVEYLNLSFKEQKEKDETDRKRKK